MRERNGLFKACNDGSWMLQSICSHAVLSNKPHPMQSQRQPTKRRLRTLQSDNTQIHPMNATSTTIQLKSHSRLIRLNECHFWISTTSITITPIAHPFSPTLPHPLSTISMIATTSLSHSPRSDLSGREEITTTHSDPFHSSSLRRPSESSTRTCPTTGSGPGTIRRPHV